MRTFQLLLHVPFAADRRKDPNQPVSLEKLRDLGVVYWKLDADNFEKDAKLAAIRQARGYSYQV